jgi:ribosomal protein S13
MKTILALKDQLADSEDLSRVARNSLKTQLMRTVDEMDRNSLRALRDELRGQMQQFTETNIEAYQSAVAEEKVVILDEAIDRMVKSRDIYSALRSRRGWRGRGRRDRGNRETRGAQSAGGQDRDKNSQRPELTQQQQAKRAQRMEFYAAMGERADERGVEISRWMRGRGR